VSLPDPIEQLSANAISQMCTSVFGPIAGPVVDTQLMDLLGLGGSSNLAAFMSKIEAALQQIESQLAALQQAVSQILAGVTVIEEKIDDAEVQAALLNFTQNAVIVREIFTTYTNSLAAVASSDAATRTQGITDLYDLLSLDNAMKVATAMTGVQESFLPSLAEQKGLISYQTTLVLDAITAARGNEGWIDNEYEHGDDAPPVYTNPTGSYGVYQGITTFVGLQAAARQMLDAQVAGTFKAFLTVSTQGLILLNAAWLRTDQEPQVGAQVSAINNVIAAMLAMGNGICDAIDTQVGSVFQSVAKSAALPDGTQFSVDCQSWSGTCPWSGGDWVQWLLSSFSAPQRGDLDLAVIAEAPWTYPSAPNYKWLYSLYESDGGGLYPDTVKVVYVNDPDEPPSNLRWAQRYDPQKATSAFFEVLAPLQRPSVQV
jgi:hypothetical protein